MTDQDGRLTPIEQIQPHDGRRTLGVRLAADGNNKAELEHLRQKSVLWAEKIRTGRLHRL